MEVGFSTIQVAIEPRVVWLMVVFVAGIGIVNYAIVRAYGGRGIAITGFFGGLASSTAVVGTMLDHANQRPAAVKYAVAAVLLADAAMALRNLAIALVFTFPGGTLTDAILPLGTVIVGTITIAIFTADWKEHIEIDLDSPFSMRNALGFGAMFLVVIMIGSIGQAQFGTIGLYVTAVLTGLVSSAGATTSAVVLYRTGGITNNEAVTAVVLATAASIVVKAALTAASSNKEFSRRIAAYSGVILGVTAVVLFVASL